ncbi:long-chain-fatty-acid--CoA ligase [delta proteobacterium NaphS2]|nr:long-chain-fatty-acid--CoA ligase [delta proteobacterium NaphS2]
MRYDKRLSTLTDALDYASRGQTGYNFYSGAGELSAALPYAKLRKEARSLARKLSNMGLSRGSRVAIVADTHPDFVRFFFACQYAGLTPVPLPAQLQLGGRKAYVAQLTRLLSICEAELAMAPDAFLPFLTDAAQGTNVRFLGAPQDYDALPETDAPLQPAKSTELAYLQYTSGSTRFPRGVMITHKAVMSNLSAIIKYGSKIREGDRAVSWLPFFHDMGLVGLLLTPMVSGISVDFLNTRDFAMRPRLWLKLMSENRGTLSIGPPFGYELVARRLRDEDAHQYDLRSWRFAGVGAEMIRPESLRQFADKLRPSGFDARAFLPCYGMAECSLAVSFGVQGQGLQTDHVDADLLSERRIAMPVPSPLAGNANQRSNTFVNCGVPLPGYESEIRDPAGRVLPERHCGALYLRGPSVMSGYFGDPEATQAVLSEDGWLNTGDLAYQVGSSIFITGRKKDLIIIHGRNIWPQDIEYLAELQPEIRTRDASAFSVPTPDGEEQAIVMVQCRVSDKRKSTELKERIQRLIGDELGIVCKVELVPRNSLPRTTSGKPSRSGARKEYLRRKSAP